MSQKVQKQYADIRRHGLKLMLGLFLSAACAGAAAQVNLDDGEFTVRSASSHLGSDDVWYVNAFVDYQLTDEMLAALDSGVALQVIVEMEVIRKRRYWFDIEDYRIHQEYQLEYHAVSDRYIVTNVNSDKRATYASLLSALNALGRIENHPLIDARLLAPGREYDVRLRSELDSKGMAGPFIRTMAFWRRGLNVETGWFQWALSPD